MTRVARIKRQERRDKLVVSHMGLAKKLAATAYRRLPNHPYEDMLAAAYVGLTQAARNFNCRRHVPFEAFARVRIAGEIIDSHRKLHKTKYVNEFPPDPTDTTEWFKGCADGRITSALGPVLMALSDVERVIVRLRYVNDMTLLEIGNHVDVKLSETMVSHLHKKALQKLREAVHRSRLTREDITG